MNDQELIDNGFTRSDMRVATSDRPLHRLQAMTTYRYLYDPDPTYEREPYVVYYRTIRPEDFGSDEEDNDEPENDNVFPMEIDHQEDTNSLDNEHSERSDDDYAEYNGKL